MRFNERKITTALAIVNTIAGIILFVMFVIWVLHLRTEALNK